MMQMQEAQLSLSLAGNASFSRWAANLFLFNDLRHRNRHSEGMFWLHFWGADRLRTLPPPHGFSNLYSPINASNKHLCLPLSLFNPSAFFFFFFPALFNVLPSHLHTQPSLLSHPPLHSPIHLSIYPSIPFGGALSGTLGLFIKASKPTASNTQPLERKRGRWRERGRWGEK